MVVQGVVIIFIIVGARSGLCEGNVDGVVFPYLFKGIRVPDPDAVSVHLDVVDLIVAVRVKLKALASAVRNEHIPFRVDGAAASRGGFDGPVGGFIRHAVLVLICAEVGHHCAVLLNILQGPNVGKGVLQVVIGVDHVAIDGDVVQGVAVLGVYGELHILSGVYSLAGRVDGAALTFYAGSDGVLGLGDIRLAVAVLVIAPGSPDLLVLIHGNRGHGVGGGVVTTVNFCTVVLGHPADEEDGDRCTV